MLSVQRPFILIVYISPSLSLSAIKLAHSVNISAILSLIQSVSWIFNSRLLSQHVGQSPSQDTHMSTLRSASLHFFCNSVSYIWETIATKINCIFRIVVFQRMVHSIRLYFRVKAKNSMGLSAMTSCELPTYDMTLPEGRITADFSSTSHPELLQGSALALDDSVIVTQKV